MIFKSPTQPRCRWCGKPIPKASERVYFGKGFGGGPTDARPERPQTRAEVARLTNGQVVSNGWNRQGQFIDTATIWDRESYQDQFFDRLACAAAMGRSVAEHQGFTTDAYRKSVAGQEGGR